MTFRKKHRAEARFVHRCRRNRARYNGKLGFNDRSGQSRDLFGNRPPQYCVKRFTVAGTPEPFPLSASTAVTLTGYPWGLRLIAA